MSGPGKSSRTFVPILIFSMSQSQHTYSDECQMRKETVEEMDASDTSFEFMVLERIRIKQIIIKKVVSDLVKIRTMQTAFFFQKKY